MKRFLALFLTICMLISMFPVIPVLAQAENSDTGIIFDYATEFYPSIKSGNDLYHMRKAFDTFPHTYEAVISIPQGTTEAGVLMGNSNDDGGEYVNIEVTKTGNPYYRFMDSKASVYSITFSKVNLFTGKWTHLAIVHNPDTKVVSCYIDGQLAQSEYYYPDYNEGTFNIPFIIGGDLDYQNNPHFKGAIKSVSIYSDARTDAEIASDFANGADLNDSDILCDFTLTSDKMKKDIEDNTGNGYDLRYSDLWVEIEDAELWRESTGMDRAYSIAAIGDIQYSSEFYPHTLKPMYQWIVDNMEENKTVYSIGLGDITNRDTYYEWQNARDAMSVMDGVLPYSVIRGNHDLKNYSASANDKYHGSAVGASSKGHAFDEFFAVDTDSDTDYIDQFKGENGGTYEEGSVMCTWRTLEVAKSKWLLLNLDHATSDAILDWASDIVEAHPDHKVIVSTHGYMNRNGEHATEGAYAGEKGPAGVKLPGGFTDVNYGANIWEKFVSQHENIQIVLCGHISSTVNPVFQRKGRNGNTVTEILIDGQSIDNRYDGLGFVTMLYFNEDGTKLEMEHYSATVGKYYRTANFIEVDLTAEGEEYDFESWNGLQIAPVGDGTKTSPYIIDNVGNLHWLSVKVAGGNSFEGKYFKQVKDLDFKNLAVNSIGYSKDYAFSGIYNGCGYSLKNGTISTVAVDNAFTKDYGYGLFGSINGAKIENITLDNMQIVGRGITGGIVGISGDVKSTVNNCAVKENCDIITLLPNGVSAPTDSTRDNSTHAGIVGGIIGLAQNVDVSYCTVQNDIIVSSIFGTVGGIAGAAGYNTLIEKSLHSGKIHVVDNKAVKDVAVGGIVGMTSPTLITEDGKAGTLHIVSCANEGELKYVGETALGVTSGFGGILGATGRLFDIDAGKYTSTVKPTVNDTPAFMIKNSYNTFALNTTAGDNTKCATGGIVGRGYALASEASSTMWLVNSASVRITRTSGGVNGYNTYNYKNSNTSYSLKVIDVALNTDGTLSVARDSNVTGHADNVAAGALAVKTEISDYRQSISGDLRWSFNETTGALKIEGVGAIADYEIDAQPWIEYKTEVKEVILGSAITGIGENAFNGFENLETVTGTPQLDTVGVGAFDGTAFVANPSNYQNNILYVSNIIIKAKESDDNTYSIKAEATAINKDAFAGITVGVVYYGGSSAQWSGIFVDDGNESLSEAQYVYEGDAVNYLFIESTGTLRVFGNGTTKTFSSNSNNQPYYRFKDKITSIVVEEGITVLGNYLAKNYSNVTSVTLPEGLTSIGTSCFEATKITSITLPETLVGIGNYAFSGCKSLKSVDIPASVKNVNRYAFYNCTSLETVTGGENISSMGQHAFRYSPFQENASYENGVLYAGNAIVIAKATSNNVYTIKKETTAIAINAFANVTVSAVYYGGEAADWANVGIGTGNDALSSATFYYGGTTMLWSFDEQTGVLTISGSGATPSFKSDASDAPWYVHKDEITSIVIEEGITELGSYFAKDFRKVTSLTLPEGLVSLGTACFQGTAITKITLPETLTVLGNYGFYGTKITAVDLPASLTHLDHNAFDNCVNLETVTGGENIKSAEENAFAGTAFIKNADNYTDGVLYLGNVVIAVINNDKSEYTIKKETVAVASNVFKNIEVSLVNFEGTRAQWSEISFGSNNSNISNAQVIFGGETYNCLFDYETGTLKVFGKGEIPGFPNDASSAPWFKYVDLVKEVIIEEGITKLGNHAFKNFTMLEKVTLPSTFKSTGSAVFENTAIKSIVIPEGFTTLGNYNFHKVKTLKEIHIPATLKSIGKSSFLNSGLETIYYYGTREQFAGITVNSTGNALFTNANVIYMTDFVIRKASVTINNDLSVNFKVYNYLFDGAGYSDTSLVVDGRQITDYTVVDNMAVFTVDGIAPHKMGDKITVTLSGTKDGNEFSDTVDFAIADYLEQIMNDYADDTKLVTLAVDALNYGAAAQIYKNYNAENLVNAALDDAQKATRDFGEIVNQISISDEIDETANWKNHSLYLEDSFEIKLGFEAENTENLSVVVKNANGEIVDTITDISITPYGKYYFYFDKLNASDIDEAFTFTVMSGETQISEALTYSASSYVTYVSEDSASFPLVNALMAYARSAYNYTAN